MLQRLGVSVRLLDHRIPRSERALTQFTAFDSHVLYIFMTSGTSFSLLDFLTEWQDLHGLVLGGFGTGNIPTTQMEGLKRILDRKIPELIITTTCLQGDTNLDLYYIGQTAKVAGVVEGGDLCPTAAVQKIMYALGVAGAFHPGLSPGEKLEKVKSLIRISVGWDMVS